MTVTYQVAGGGHLDIDFFLTDPQNHPLYQLSKKDTGTYSFTADKEFVSWRSRVSKADRMRFQREVHLLLLQRVLHRHSQDHLLQRARRHVRRG
jgi:hypothetical protein